MLYLIQAKRKGGEKLMREKLKTQYVGEGMYLLSRREKSFLISKEEITKLFFKKLKKDLTE